MIITKTIPAVIVISIDNTIDYNGNSGNKGNSGIKMYLCCSSIHS